MRERWTLSLLWWRLTFTLWSFYYDLKEGRHGKEEIWQANAAPEAHSE